MKKVTIFVGIIGVIGTMIFILNKPAKEVKLNKESSISFGATPQVFTPTQEIKELKYVKQNPKEYFQVITATTSYQGPAKRFTHYFNSIYEEQGTCIAIKDKSGNGWTYLTTFNGVLEVSAVSCE